MSATLRLTGGLRLAGAATAWPVDVPGAEAPELDGPATAARLLGADWEERAARRGQDVADLARRLGVERRGFVGRGAGPFLELAECAARRALERARIAPEAVELVVLATSSSPRATASAACALAGRLGGDAAALDLRSGGAGGLHAVAHGAQAVASGARVVLVLAVEVLGPWLSPADLANGLLFGDGAAALVLVPDPDVQRGRTVLHAGSLRAAGRAFSVPADLPPLSPAELGEALRFQRPDAPYLADLDRAWERAVAAAAAERCEARELVLAPYAVTRDRTRAVAEALGGAASPALRVLAEHGCCGCAMPLAVLAEIVGEHGLPPDSCWTSVAAGGGISWAAWSWST